MDLIKKYLLICVFVSTASTVVAQQVTKDLNDYLMQAKMYSPLLKDLNNQKRSNGIDSLIVKATAKPQLTANSAGLYAPIVKGYGFDEVITNGQSLEALLSLNYDLLNQKRIHNQLEGVKLQSDSIKYAVQLSLFDLNRSIIDQYIVAYSSQDLVDFNRDVVLLLQKEEHLLKQLTRNNIYKQSEYLTFLVTLQQQQLVLKQAELQFKNDFSTLNYLSGNTDTVTVRLSQPQLKEDAAVAQSSFFTTRFDIDSLKNLNQKVAVDLNYKPKLGVFANGGYSSSLVLQPYKNFGTSVGFTLSIPIYDGHQRKMQHDKLSLANNTVSGYRDFFIRQQKQQLNLIGQQLNETNSLYQKINNQIRLSKGLIDVDSKLLHTGDLRVADFVLAINNYMSAQNLLRQTNINRLKLINQFNYWNR